MTSVQKIKYACVLGAFFFLGELPAQAPPTVVITSPNGGETLTLGSVYRITWTSTNVDTVTLGYSSCPSCLALIINQIPNTGSYDWTVNVGNSASAKFKIYILGYQTGVGSASDYSDADFTVLGNTSSSLPIVRSISPSATQAAPGNQVTLSGPNLWTTLSGNDYRVRISNTSAGADVQKFNTVLNTSATGGTLAFYVPGSLPAGAYDVCIVMSQGTSNCVSLTLTSSGSTPLPLPLPPPAPTPSPTPVPPPTISSSYVKVLSPNGGETLMSGTTYDIKYISSYPSDNQPETAVALYQGNTLLGYPVQWASSPGIIKWNVPQYTVTGSGPAQNAPPGSNYFIKVYMAGGLQDLSDAPFSIGSPSSSVQPVDVSSRVVGTTQDGTEIDYTFMPSSAAKWMITVVCTNPVTATTKGGGDCGETIGFSFTTSPVLPFWFKNPTNTYQTVGIKVSAYDANGTLIGGDSDSVSIPPTANASQPVPVATSNQTGDLSRLQQQIAALQQQLAKLQNQNQPPIATAPSQSANPTGSSNNQEGDTAPTSATVSFDHDLYFGMRNNEDVSNLQEFLIDQGFLKGSASGNYFILTQRAVKRFQAAHNVKASGYFGPVTRKIANGILAGM